MLDDDIIYIIILTVLVYIFEHKVLPTLITWAISFWRISVLVAVSPFPESSVVLIFIYIIVFFYAAYMVFISPVVHEQGADI